MTSGGGGGSGDIGKSSSFESSSQPLPSAPFLFNIYQKETQFYVYIFSSTTTIKIVIFIKDLLKVFNSSKQCLETNRNYLKNVSVRFGLVRFVVLRVLEQNAVHIGRGVLKEFVIAVEYDNHNLALAQHTQLVRFLHQTEFALCERHLLFLFLFCFVIQILFTLIFRCFYFYYYFLLSKNL